MTVTPLPLPTTSRLGADEPDAPLAAPSSPNAQHAFGQALLSAFDAASTALERADRAERAFTVGRGGLQEMVLERAQADIALSLASTAAGHVTQALGTILGMQV